MHPRFKCVVAIIVAMAAWLVTSPVWAAQLSSPSLSPSPSPGDCARGSRSAPLCDSRGATMFGPTPTLDAPAASIDIGHGAQEDALRLLGLHAYEQGRTPVPWTSHAIPEATLTARGHVMRSPLLGLLRRYFPEERGSPGIRPSLERPPRAA